jgi:hypothetical protein
MHDDAIVIDFVVLWQRTFVHRSLNQTANTKDIVHSFYKDGIGCPRSWNFLFGIFTIFKKLFILATILLLTMHYISHATMIQFM